MRVLHRILYISRHFWFGWNWHIGELLAYPKHLITLGSLILLVSCSGLRPVERVSATPVQEIPLLTLVTADSLWDARHYPEAAEQALFFYKHLSTQDSLDLHIWTRLSRTLYFNALYLEHDPAVQDSLYLAGYEVSQAILQRNPEYQQLLLSTGDEKIAIRGLDREYLDAMYWGIANYGQWLATKGELVRKAQRTLVLTTLEYIHELDSSYYFSAYERYLGALLCRDPMAEGELDQARAAFDAAIEAYPDYLGTYTLMARYYCRATGDKDLFYNLLTTVVTSTPGTDLPYYPENEHERQLAERLMIQAENEKWFVP